MTYVVDVGAFFNSKQTKTIFCWNVFFLLHLLQTQNNYYRRKVYEYRNFKRAGEGNVAGVSA